MRWYDERTGHRRGYRVVDETGRVRGHFPFEGLPSWNVRAAAERRARTLEARGIARARIAAEGEGE